MSDLPYLRQPPFDSLTDSERSQLARHSQIVYLDSLQAVPSDWFGDFFLLIKGQVYQQQGDELIANLNVGDWFDTRAKNDSPPPSFITQQQTLLYRMDGKALSDITARNATLNNLLFADLTARVAQHQARLAHSESQQLLYQPIASLDGHIKPPQFIEATATLHEACVAMLTHDAKHVLVTSTKRLPDSERDRLLAAGVEKSTLPEFIPHIGVITQSDICRAVSQRVDVNTAQVAEFSDFRLQTIHQQQDVSEALLTMLAKRVHRLPVVDSHGEIVGVLGQTELLNYLTNHSQLIVARIEQATTLADIHQAVEMVGKFIRQQQQTGVKIHVISRMVQSLNSQIFAKVWQLTVPALTFYNTCLIVMGSEGRGEQILRTDQDNALIIRNGFKDENLPKYAEVFNQTLAEMGYPLCDGNIMITNPQWRKTVTAFEQQINQWLTTGDADSLIWFATLQDAQPVCGDVKLFEPLQRHSHNAYRNLASSNFINRFAKPILQFGDGTHFWQKFTGQADNDIDLKKVGIFPIVHGVRTLALEQQLTVTNTRQRLQLLADRQVLDPKTAQNLAEALDFFLAKRLAVALATPNRTARKVNPNSLSAMDKDMLKEALAIVKAFKTFITHRYRLDIF